MTSILSVWVEWRSLVSKTETQSYHPQTRRSLVFHDPSLTDPRLRRRGYVTYTLNLRFNELETLGNKKGNRFSVIVIMIISQQPPNILYYEYVVFTIRELCTVTDHNNDIKNGV